MRNLYKLLIIRLIINLADSLFYVVTIWRVADEFHSTIASGLLVAIFSVPEVLQIFIGPFIDHFNSKKILTVAIYSQIIILVTLLLTWEIHNILLICLLALFSSFSSAITYPIEDVLIPQLVQQDKLVFANSLFSISYQVMDSLFNAASGVLLTVFTFAVLYQSDLALFGIVLIPLIFFRVQDKTISGRESFKIKNYLLDLQEGYKFIVSSDILLEMSIPLIFMNFFNSVNSVALPYYCKTFARPTIFFGIISTAAGIGGIIGSLLINYFVKKIGSGKLISWGLLLNGLLWIAGVLAHDVIITTVLISLSYMVSGMYNIVYSTLYQALPPISLLGRVNTTTDSLITVAMPIGGIVGGFLLSKLSPTIVLSLFGFCALLSGLFYAKKSLFQSLPIVSKLNRIE